MVRIQPSLDGVPVQVTKSLMGFTLSVLVEEKFVVLDDDLVDRSKKSRAPKPWLTRYYALAGFAEFQGKNVFHSLRRFTSSDATSTRPEMLCLRELLASCTRGGSSLASGFEQLVQEPVLAADGKKFQCPPEIRDPCVLLCAIDKNVADDVFIAKCTGAGNVHLLCHLSPVTCIRFRD
jgi:hypothetical protein